jgi:IclR family KDG regulon transcriptional repressor
LVVAPRVHMSSVRRKGRLSKRTAEDRTPRRVVQSLQRGLEIMTFVAEAGSPVKLQDIVRHFGIDKASAFRLLGTLEVQGFVRKHPVDKSYLVGGKLLQWISSPRHDQQLMQLARPHLERLAQGSRESSHLAVLTGTRVTLIDVVPPDALVAIKHSVGSTVEMYCSAVGKALLAYMPAELQNRLIADIEFRRFTTRTIMEAGKLRDELEVVRKTGHALDDAEYNDWIFCIAAPILDARGLAVASLGLSVFKPTLEEDKRRLALLRADVCDCAAAVTRDLREIPSAIAS